jgi:hypothetical protein
MTLYQQLFNKLKSEIEEIKKWRAKESEAIARFNATLDDSTWDENDQAYDDYDNASAHIMGLYEIISYELDAAYAGVPFKATRLAGKNGFYRLMEEYLAE